MLKGFSFMESSLQSCYYYSLCSASLLKAILLLVDNIEDLRKSAKDRMEAEREREMEAQKSIMNNSPAAKLVKCSGEEEEEKRSPDAVAEKSQEGTPEKKSLFDNNGHGEKSPVEFDHPACRAGGEAAGTTSLIIEVRDKLSGIDASDESNNKSIA